MNSLKTKSRKYYLLFNLPIQVCAIIGVFLGNIDWMIVAVSYIMIYWLGIQAGSHKLFSHRSWQPKFVWLKYLIAWLGCFGMMGGPISWAAYHRWHHAHSDKDLDPHSPSKGIWHAWAGWLMDPPPVPANIIKDHIKDRPLLWLDTHCISVVAIPMVLLCILGVHLAASISMAMLLTFHSEMAVNALLHKETDGKWTAQNANWLWFVSGGSNLHANHHDRPGDYDFAKQWYELDLSSWFVRALKI